VAAIVRDRWVAGDVEEPVEVFFLFDELILVVREEK
jgi:hypothetical protein